MNFSNKYLQETEQIAAQISAEAIETVVDELACLRERGGRLFVLGVGGSAANASHAVNDFRKICNLECYSPSDNVSELTARVNDEGWETVYSQWLTGSRLSSMDGILILSVGGGSVEPKVSVNLVNAMVYAENVGAVILGIVGRDGGYTEKVARACVVIPVVNPVHITPHSETFQAVVWHLMVSHPRLRSNSTKWESVVQDVENDLGQ